MEINSRISIVVAVGSNDIDNDKLLRQVDIFYRTLIGQLVKYNLKAELIVVDWNPSENRTELLSDILLNILSRNNCVNLDVRIVTVPKDIHRGFRNSETIQFFDLIARNVGIRRAKAHYVLATSINTIFSNELITHIFKSKFDPKAFYTLFCKAIPDGIPDGTINEIIAWCSKSAASSGFESTKSEDWSYIRAFLKKIKRKIKKPLVKWKPLVKETVCREFVLTSKENWSRAHGYLELPVNSLNLDKILAYMLASLGLKQVVMNLCGNLYHVGNDINYLDMTIKERIDVFRQMPWLDDTVWKKLREYYINGGEPIMLNASDWGLEGYMLPERFLTLKRSGSQNDRQ